MIIEERGAEMQEFFGVKKNAIAEYFKKKVKGSPIFKVTVIFNEKKEPKKMIIEEIEQSESFIKRMLKG